MREGFLSTAVARRGLGQTSSTQRLQLAAAAALQGRSGNRSCKLDHETQSATTTGMTLWEKKLWMPHD